MPENVKPGQSTSGSVPRICGTRLYGGVTGAFGSCSVWNFCARASSDSGPNVAAKPPSRGSVVCDVTATRSDRSAKYVSSETLFRLK